MKHLTLSFEKKHVVYLRLSFLCISLKKRVRIYYVYVCMLLLFTNGCVATQSHSPEPLLRQVFCQGIRLNYALQPNSDAPLLFFIHGAPGSWKAYRKYLRDSSLSAAFQMVSVDRPSYGGSGSGRIFASLDVQSRLLGEILSLYAKERPTILVGHSYGGAVALRMAMDYPQQVQAVLLLAPAIDPALEKPGKWRFWIRTAPLRWLVPSLLYVTNEEIIALKKNLQALETEYEHLKVPVYYIHGTKDMLVSVANQYYAKRHMKHLSLQVRIIRGANHFIPWTHYSEVIKGIYYLRDALRK